MPKPMKYDKKFAFLLSKKELQDIDELAEKLERSRSDAVRVVVRNAVEGVRNLENNEKEVSN